MKIFRTFFCMGLIVFFVIIAPITLGENLQYKRIGNTNFYLMETYAISKEGLPLANLYYKYDDSETYEGVCMYGYPLYIMWNSDYVITKNYDGNHSKIISYNIIRVYQSKSTNKPFKVYEFLTKSAYYIGLHNLGIDEQILKCTDNNIPWSLHLLD